MNEKEQIDRIFGVFRRIMEEPRGQLIDFEVERTKRLAKKMTDETQPRPTKDDDPSGIS